MTISAAEQWESATEEQRDRQRLKAYERRADREAHPLAYAKLWDTPRTSQQRVMRGLGADATLVAGGNGSGKTHLGGQVAVAFLLGRNHPDVQRWLKLNDLDGALLPPDGGPVIASSLNSALSVDVQRRMVAAFLPSNGAEWRNRNGPGVASVTFGKHKIAFLTNDAGARAFQGYAAGLIWLDEEHDEPVYNECLQRISRFRWDGRSGWAIKTMTPLKGMTYVHRRFVEEPDDGTAYFELHGGDNPHLDQEKRDRLLQGYGAHEREARDKGSFVALEGRVFTDYARHLHIVPSFAVPAEWVKFAGWDFGTRNPTAIVWCAHDPSDDTIHVYREHYAADRPLAWHAERFAALSKTEDLEFLVCDAADRGARMTLMQTHGIPNVPCKKGPNSVRAGINAIAARLAPDAEGRPHVVIHDCCTSLIKEVESYRWDTGRSKGDMADAPLKKADHAIDAWRYAMTMFQRSGYV